MMDKPHCYICKLGWLNTEDSPKLVCHEGLYYCEPCHEVIQERIRKNHQEDLTYEKRSAWGEPTVDME